MRACVRACVRVRTHFRVVAHPHNGVPLSVPENILLKDNGYCLLSDFGVAKLLENTEDCRSTSGTHG